MTMSEYKMLIRCPKCGFGMRIKGDSILADCLKCGEKVRVTEARTIRA